MEVTGYRLMARLRELMNRRDALYAGFEDSLNVFPDELELKRHPVDMSRDIEDLERKIALLQTMQHAYNLTVWVDSVYTLAVAIKLVGGAGRLAKMWRKVAIQPRDRYSYGRDDVRQVGEIRKQARVGAEEALSRNSSYEAWASDLREKIQIGNATTIDLSPRFAKSDLEFVFG